MKKVTAIILAIVLITASLAGCAGGKTPAESPSPSASTAPSPSTPASASPSAAPTPSASPSPAAPAAAAYDPEAFYNNGGFNVPGLTFQPSRPDTQGSRFEPVEVFENVYFIGDSWVCCMLYVTDEGIIMWDALECAEDMTDILQPDMEKLGLDIADIKVCLVSHGHGDHYGGARYLQDTYGTKIYMSEADMPTMLSARDTPNSKWNEKTQPVIDEYLVDGGTYTLGGVTFSFMATPGHTPGSMSFFVPVTALDGSGHTLTCWGGTSAPRDAEGVKTYLASVQKYREYINKNGIDAFLSMHPFVDYSTDNVAKVRETGSSDALIRTPEQMDFFLWTLQVYTQMKGRLAANGLSEFTSEGYGSAVLSMPYIVYIPEAANGNGYAYLDQIIRAEIFDDVYYVGTGASACLIYDTKDGIVITDAMTGQNDFTQIVKPAMAAFGLDPKEIKAVFLTSGKPESTGFAAYVQETYGAKVYMSKADAALSPELKADEDLAAGTQKFGKFSFEWLATPGTTDGTMSYIVNVTVDGAKHTAACWGGAEFVYEKASLESYCKSMASFMELCASKKADALVSSRPYFNYAVEKVLDLIAGDETAFVLDGDATVEFTLSCVSLAAQYKLKYFGA